MSKYILPKETAKLLYKYFDAAQNLYGIAPLNKLLEIYNNQNQPITEEQFLKFVDNMDLSNKFYDIIGVDEMYEDVPPVKPINRDIVAEYLYYPNTETYYKVKENQRIFSFYVPKKEKFLKYADECYFEKTLEFISLRAFLRNQKYLTKEKADEIAGELQFVARIENGNPDFIIQCAESMGVNLDNLNIYQEFVDLFIDVDNNTRKHIYCGHTHNEVF